MLLNFIAFFTAIADPGASQVSPHAGRAQCDSRSLSEVFSNPTHYFGKTFCGRVLVVRRGRGLLVLPLGRTTPVDRDDIAVILDDDTERHIRALRGSVFYFYLEGDISGMEECFTPPEPGYTNLCVPIHHPIFIHVTRYRQIRPR